MECYNHFMTPGDKGDWCKEDKHWWGKVNVLYFQQLISAAYTAVKLPSIIGNITYKVRQKPFWTSLIKADE